MWRDVPIIGLVKMSIWVLNPNGLFDQINIREIESLMIV